MKIGFCWLLFLAALTGRAQVLSPEQARADLRYLLTKLDRLHPGLGYYTPDSVYRRRADSLLAVQSAPISYRYLYRQAAFLVAGLKDGHTALLHRKGYFSKQHVSGETRWLPLTIRQVGSSFYILYNLSDDSTLVRGTEVLSFNGRPITAIQDTILTYERSGSDGDNLSGRRFRTTLQFSSHYASWFGLSDSVRLTYRLRGDSTIRTVRLACLTNTERNRYLVKRYPKEAGKKEKSLTLTSIDSLEHTAVLRVSTFSPRTGDWLNRSFPRNLKKAFRQIQAKQIRHLIVDVRSNGGGAVINSARLLRYWMPEPFQVMRPGQVKRGGRNVLVKAYNPFTWALFPIFYKRDSTGGFVERPRRRKYRPHTKLAFRGKLYFLMNGASYSATASVLSKTLDAGLGTYVGEACGGAYWGDFAGQFKTVTLPHSRLRVRIPLKKMIHDVDPTHANGFTVEPDFPVERTVDDIVSGRDFGLDFVVKLIREGKLAEREINRHSIQALQIN